MIKPQKGKRELAEFYQTRRKNAKFGFNHKGHKEHKGKTID
jgi:hypothetical protein